jgi:hypothetical protein
MLLLLASCAAPAPEAPGALIATLDRDLAPARLLAGGGGRKEFSTAGQPCAATLDPD